MKKEKAQHEIQQQLADGVDEGEIRASLRFRGFEESDINAMIAEAKGEKDPAAAPRERPSLAGAGTLFSRTFDRYGRRFSTFIGIIAVPMAFSALLAFIAPAENPRTGEMTSYLTNLGVDPEVASIIGLIILPISFLVSVWGHVALFYAITNKKLGIFDAYRESWAKIFSFWWVSLLVAAVVMGGTLLLIVPGILFAVWLMFAPLLTVTEGRHGTAALMRSKKYVEGNWWPVAWRLFAIAASLFFAFMIVMLVTMFAFGLSFVSELLFYVAGAVLTPVGSVYVYELYRSLKKRKTKKELTLTERDAATRNVVIVVALLPVFIFLGLIIAGWTA